MRIMENSVLNKINPRDFFRAGVRRMSRLGPSASAGAIFLRREHLCHPAGNFCVLGTARQKTFNIKN